MTERARTILHVDLDAFYASVEQRDDPRLRGRPVIVGGSVERGVVAAASYEARPYGIGSAMPMAEAMRRCPHAVRLSPRMEHYGDASRAFFAILDRYAPRVEGLSLDEAFVDVTGEDRLFGGGAAVARAIKAAVADELALVASVGVAPTKFVAKIASDIDKPDGLCEVADGEVDAFLHPLPVTRLWGVGRATRRRLGELGLATIGDVARYPPDLLARQLGDGLGGHLSALARGDDPREVEPESEPVSLGHEETFDRDRGRREDIEPVLLHQADRVAARLRRRGLRATVVVVKIKYADFRQITRRRTLADPTCDGRRIGRAAAEILAQIPVTDSGGRRGRVRLAGVAVSSLEDRDAPRQLTLDEPVRQRGERLGDALDRIESRFGPSAIGRAAYTRGKS